MIGNSWAGFNALQVAALRPPALGAIVTSCSTDDRYADDMHYMGGCLLTDTLDWGTMFQALLALPPDPALVGDRWREMWQRGWTTVSVPVEAWLRHQRRDDFWRHGSVVRGLRGHRGPGARRRWLARRLLERDPAPARRACPSRAAASSGRGRTPTRTSRVRGPATTSWPRSCAGSTTG